eukprot:scaffold15313_cov132-Isochrysis_galbana.AAC.5
MTDHHPCPNTHRVPIAGEAAYIAKTAHITDLLLLLLHAKGDELRPSGSGVDVRGLAGDAHLSCTEG